MGTIGSRMNDLRTEIPKVRTKKSPSISPNVSQKLLHLNVRSLVENDPLV